MHQRLSSLTLFVLSSAVVIGITGCQESDGQLTDGGPYDGGHFDGGSSDSDGGDAGPQSDAHVDGSSDGATVDGRMRLPRGVYPLTLTSAAFPSVSGRPSAVVVVPSNFDPAPPISIAIYIHGFSNCVTNVISDQNASCNAASGTPVRNSSHLATQLENSGKNVLLIVPEVAYDARDPNPGKLGQTNGMRDLISETFTQLTPVLGPLTISDLGQTLLFTHSGGYLAAAKIARIGGIPIDELCLLDSLYENSSDFDAWTRQELSAHGSMPPMRRLMVVYTDDGGTRSNSQAMAMRALMWVMMTPALPMSTLVDDRTTATWPNSTYEHGLLFKRSGLSHTDVSRYYFGKFVETSLTPSR